MSEEKVVDTVIEEADTVLTNPNETMVNSNLGVALAGGAVGALLMIAGMKAWSWIKNRKQDQKPDDYVEVLSEDENVDEE